MSRLLFAAAILLNIGVAHAGGKKVAAAGPRLDCAAYTQHLNDVAFADFQKNEGKDLSTAELAVARVQFPAEMAKDPDIQSVMKMCRANQLPRSVYDCQMKAATLDAFEKCGE